MKNIWLIISATLTLTLLAGCKGDEPAIETPSEDVKFELLSSVVDVTADGGHFKVDYTLTGATEGAELKYNVEKSWVYNVDTSVDGVISFDVAESFDTEARTCRLELIYPGLYPNPMITIKQEKGKEWI